MSAAPPDDRLDPGDPRLVAAPPSTLAPFNLAGVLGPADVHAARTLGELVGESRPDVLLAAALAIRAPQHGHVCVELSGVAGTVTGREDAEVALGELRWPDPARWREAIADSALVTVRPAGTPERLDPHDDRPLTLVGDRLYLDRYWRYERRVAEVLRRRAGRLNPDVEHPAIRAALDRLLPPSGQRPDLQRLAVATAMTRRLAVVAGGPGTGKTYTVARLLAVAYELWGPRWPRVAVVAPTGKAADRLTAALRAAADDVDTDPAVRQHLRTLEASTIHRLLGWNPASDTRFRYGRDRQLPHQLVVVDETSMVDLALMSKLLVALRTDATLVLVGDPDQLASVEAGAVLSDIVGPVGDRPRMSPAVRNTLEAATGEPLDDVATARPGGLDDAIVVLGRVRRYSPGSGIARLAAAIHRGDGDAATSALRAGGDDLEWIEVTGDATDHGELGTVRAAVTSASAPVLVAAHRGDAAGALAALDRLRVLCAHRRGPAGVAGWRPLVERWLAEDLDRFASSERWYVGRPVLVTRNEPRLRLYNGDVGVVVRDGASVVVAFHGADGPRRFGPSRLEHVETVHAMTIHKSQGSEFDHVVAVLPDATSPILTRELLYTAVTRARSRVTIVGQEDAIRAAIERPVSRAAGLREALWGSTDG